VGQGVDLFLRSPDKPPFFLGRTRIKQAVNAFLEFDLKRLRRRRRLAGKRREVEYYFRRLADRPGRLEGAVLIDATWDNPNYWARLSLFRAALGVVSGNEVAVVAPPRNEITTKCLNNLGITRIEEYKDTAIDERFLTKACDLLAKTNAPGDILSWRLPYDLPADIVMYDAILKKQRMPCIDLSDPKIEGYVATILRIIDNNMELLDRIRPQLLLLSHLSGFFSATLGMLAAQKNIPAIFLGGRFGTERFKKITGKSYFYDYFDVPKNKDLNFMIPNKVKALAEIGDAYLKKRFLGETTDIGGIYAYQKRKKHVERKDILEKFGWNPDLPIVVVYASNWFDYPHTYGMNQFRDFLDWIGATVAVAREVTDVNWLFKAHPCDAWYKGSTLDDILPDPIAVHVRHAQKDWQGKSLINCVDAMITYHGSIGIEGAALGKPVMVADRGFYHDFGFVHFPKNREAYIHALRKAWWSDMDMDDAAFRAKVFAGLFYGAPDWRKGFIFDDDTRGEELYETMLDKFEQNREVVDRVINEISDWWESDHDRLHVYLMDKAEGYQLSNAVETGSLVNSKKSP